MKSDSSAHGRPVALRPTLPLLSSGELQELQDTLGVVFRQPGLLGAAFVHRSYLNENGGKGLRNNERLEFLGDAMLEGVITEHLYRAFPDLPEGDLTALRSALVNGKTLGEVAESMRFADFLRCSKGQERELQTNEKARRYILACTFEAVIGAMYIDRGLGTVELFLGEALLPRLPTILEQKLYLAPKSHLQELIQRTSDVAPRYEVLAEQGPDHQKKYLISVYHGERCLGEGEGFSKSEAETNAAKSALFNEFQITLQS